MRSTDKEVKSKQKRSEGRRAKLAEEARTEELLEKHRDLVKAKAHLYFMLGGDIEDIIQEGMIGLCKAIKSFDASKGASFRTFADICITRQMISAVKAATRKKNSPLNSALSFDIALSEGEGGTTLSETLAAGTDSDPETLTLVHEMTELLLAPGAKILSKSEREVLSLLMEAKDYREIASELDKTPKQIDNAIQRIRGKIKKLL